MKSFLSKYMDAESLKALEDAYKEKNPNSNGLPIYIPKSRFDEVDGQRKTAEDALKAVPTDWKEQLDALKQSVATQKSDYEKQLTDMKTDYESKLSAAATAADRTAKVYGAGARNVKAVMALLDDKTPIDDQLKALKESDPYLFSRAGMNKGTGKGDGDHGGEGDDKGADGKLSTADMYRAVGIEPPTK